MDGDAAVGAAVITQRDNVHPLPSRGITALKVRRVNKGKLIGFVDLEIHAWHMVLNDCRWMSGEHGEWIALPSTSFQTKEGTTRYKDLVEFTDPEAKRRFQEAALAAIRSS